MLCSGLYPHWICDVFWFLLLFVFLLQSLLATPVCVCVCVCAYVAMCVSSVQEWVSPILLSDFCRWAVICIAGTVGGISARRSGDHTVQHVYPWPSYPHGRVMLVQGRALHHGTGTRPSPLVIIRHLAKHWHWFPHDIGAKQELICCIFRLP